MRRRPWLVRLVDDAATLHEHAARADADVDAWRAGFARVEARAADFRRRMVDDVERGDADSFRLATGYDALWDLVEEWREDVAETVRERREAERAFVDDVCAKLDDAVRALDVRDGDTARDAVSDVRDALSVYAHGLRDVSQELGRLHGAAADKRRNKTRRGA